MGEITRAFAKGGCGCLSALAILSMITILAGGIPDVDFGGWVCSFLFGGIIGLIVLAIYNRGRRDGEQAKEFDEPDDDIEEEA